MKRVNRYGVRSLERDFPTEEVALDFIFDALHSRQCSCGGTYKLLRRKDKKDGKLKGTKQYQCSKCRFQIAPLAGTIFHKSDTPLLLWFKAILAFSNAKSGISARQLEREIETTYKTAWRMLTLIRKALAQNSDKLKGIVEIDVGYLGGMRRAGKDNKNQKAVMANKTAVMAAKERNGSIKALVVPNATAETHSAFLETYVEKESVLMSDKTHSLKSKARTKDYDHHTVNHGKQEYARGQVHVNNVEAFFGHVKRSVRGVHKSISPQHAQEYLNGFVFHWNNSRSDRERFALLLGRLLQPVK